MTLKTIRFKKNWCMSPVILDDCCSHWFINNENWQFKRLLNQSCIGTKRAAVLQGLAAAVCHSLTAWLILTPGSDRLSNEIQIQGLARSVDSTPADNRCYSNELPTIKINRAAVLRVDKAAALWGPWQTSSLRGPPRITVCWINEQLKDDEDNWGDESRFMTFYVVPPTVGQQTALRKCNLQGSSIQLSAPLALICLSCPLVVIKTQAHFRAVD